ncbi:hypothetical protein EVA_19999 [gut metagenome]|uniref:Uncharacterized protein n=1 Tax=gut metagenome TaxID=749906 RepID=J9FWZ8_9ZZZZ
MAPAIQARPLGGAGTHRSSHTSRPMITFSSLSASRISSPKGISM